jgi:hypothetical protein
MKLIFPEKDSRALTVESDLETLINKTNNTREQNVTNSVEIMMDTHSYDRLRQKEEHKLEHPGGLNST